MVFSFNAKHTCIALTFLTVEVLIALFVHDRYIRPFIGDLLVVILIYFATSSLIKADAVKLAFIVFIFACTIELLQYFQVAAWLDLQKGSVLYIALGATFDTWDLVAYASGTIIILLYLQITKRYSNIFSY